MRVNNAFVVNPYDPAVERILTDPAGLSVAAAEMWFPPPVMIIGTYFTPGADD